MRETIIFLSGLATTAAITAAALLYLRRPLQRQLVELCGNAERASFWTSFTTITVGLVPLIFALQAKPSGTDRLAIFVFADELKWGLIGLALSVLVVGKVVGKFLPKPVVVAPPVITPTAPHAPVA